MIVDKLINTFLIFLITISFGYKLNAQFDYSIFITAIKHDEFSTGFSNQMTIGKELGKYYIPDISFRATKNSLFLHFDYENRLINPLTIENEDFPRNTPSDFFPYDENWISSWLTVNVGYTIYQRKYFEVNVQGGFNYIINNNYNTNYGRYGEFFMNPISFAGDVTLDFKPLNKLLVQLQLGFDRYASIYRNLNIANSLDRFNVFSAALKLGVSIN